MNKDDIAWDYLTDIQKAQLIKFYPELEKEEEDDSQRHSNKEC